MHIRRGVAQAHRPNAYVLPGEQHVRREAEAQPRDQAAQHHGHRLVSRAEGYRSRRARHGEGGPLLIVTAYGEGLHGRLVALPAVGGREVLPSHVRQGVDGVLASGGDGLTQGRAAVAEVAVQDAPATVPDEDVKVLDGGHRRAEGGGAGVTRLAGKGQGDEGVPVTSRWRAGLHLRAGPCRQQGRRKNNMQVCFHDVLSSGFRHIFSMIVPPSSHGAICTLTVPLTKSRPIHMSSRSSLLQE